MVKVLFVCMGNICRSPTGEGILTKMVQEQDLDHQITVDSAGTHSYHIGSTPDVRSFKMALSRGVDISSQRARRFTINDFEDFDYILAMDSSNLRDIRDMCPVGYEEKVKLCLDYSTNSQGQDVPDPYYGQGDGFARVFDMVDDACRGLLTEIKADKL